MHGHAMIPLLYFSRSHLDGSKGLSFGFNLSPDQAKQHPQTYINCLGIRCRLRFPTIFQGSTLGAVGGKSVATQVVGAEVDHRQHRAGGCWTSEEIHVLDAANCFEGTLSISTCPMVLLLWNN